MERPQVGLDESRVIILHRAGHARPGPLDGQQARNVAAIELLAVLIENYRLDAEERKRC